METIKGNGGKVVNIRERNDGEGFDVFFCYNHGETVETRKCYKTHKMALSKAEKYVAS